MTRPISHLDVPLTVLQQQMRDLDARQRTEVTDLADRSAQSLTTILAPRDAEVLRNAAQALEDAGHDDAATLLYLLANPTTTEA